MNVVFLLCSNMIVSDCNIIESYIIIVQLINSEEKKTSIYTEVSFFFARSRIKKNLGDTWKSFYN